MNSHRALDELIGGVYDAALGRLSWTEIGDRLRGAIGSTSASIFVKHPDSTVESLVGMAGPKTVKAYIEEFAAHDLWHHESVRKGICGRAARGSEAVPDSVFERSYYYNEFSRTFANDVFYCCGMVDDLESGAAAVVALHRTRREGDFGEESLAFLNALKPHLYRAFDVGGRLKSVGSSQAAGAPLVEANLPWGVIELSADLRVLRLNDLAASFLSAGDGLAQIGGRLAAAQPADNRRLQEVLRGATLAAAGGRGGSSGGYARVARRSGATPYSVLAFPPGRDRVALGPGSCAAVAFVADPELEAPISREALRDLFDLTPAEARVVLGLVNGESLRGVAAASGTSYQTVRTLLGRAMPKIGVASQTALVRRISAIPARRS